MELSTSCQGRFVQLKMDRLREINSSEGQQTPNKVSAFASQDFMWSEPVETDVNGNDSETVRGTLVSFSSPVRIGGNGPNAPTANFTMTTITYHENGTAQNGNDTIFVPEGALKFTIEIDGWPFLDTENSLEFGVDVRVGNDTLQQLGNRTGTEPNNLRFDFADGLSIDVPTTALIDGMQTNISATLESTTDGYSLDWEFPSFNESLFYDPVVGENLRSVGSGGEYNENESPDTTMPSSSPSEPPSSTPTLLDDDEDDDDEMDPQNSDGGGRGINDFQQCWLSWRLP
eukprot:scaffold4365_cov147-Skeletonema_menzelii.AAC.4